MGDWKVITLKIDPLLLQRLDLYAINHRSDRSAIIRKAIEELLDREEYSKFNNTIENTQYAKFRLTTREL